MESNDYIRLTKSHLSEYARNKVTCQMLDESAERERLRYHLSKLEMCLESLEEDSKKAVICHYVHGASYHRLAYDMCWSVRTCKRRVKKAVEDIAFMLYGEKSQGDYKFI